MEHIQVVTESAGQPTGVVLPRNEIIEGRHWCQSTNVFVLNSEGDILCHRRSMEKERYPGVWFTHVGGHIGHGETFEDNARKELEEEAGVSVSNDQLLFWRLTKVPVSRLWAHEFVTVIDKKAEEFIPQPGEVDEFKWFTAEEIFEQSRYNPQSWKAGTHNFMVEYYCLRAVVAAASTQGTFALQKPLHVWSLHPIAP